MRRVTAAFVLAVLVGLGVWLYLNRQISPAKAIDRIPKLTKIVADQEQESVQAVANYHPNAPIRLNDLGSSVVEILQQLPGVDQVEVGVRVESPTCRIVHLRDRHFVPKDLYALDLKDANGRELPAEEIALRHRELLLEVEAVQLEQTALLRCLIKHHGLRRIYCEGLTPNDLPNYKEQIAHLRDVEQKDIGVLRRQLVDVRDLLKGMDSKAERYEKARKLEADVSEMIDQQRLRLLELGAPGRLLIAGEIDEVLPLEDAGLLDAAKPISPDGKVRVDPDRLKARQDAQVKSVLAKGGFGLIVLGGSHDLTENVQRLGQGRCEYIRVTTRRFKEFSE